VFRCPDSGAIMVNDRLIWTASVRAIGAIFGSVGKRQAVSRQNDPSAISRQDQARVMQP